MKALTLWEPWATLIAVGLKRFETRHWRTSYRGDLVIHAAAKRDREILDYLREMRHEIAAACREAGVAYPVCQFGKALCVVTLADVRPTETVPEDERAFGDFSPGRFAWELTNVRKIEPIAVKGAQLLWEYTEPIVYLDETSAAPALPDDLHQLRLF